MDFQFTFKVFVTVLCLLLLAVPGFILEKTGMFPKKAGKALSILVLYGCQPMLLFMSFQKTAYSPELGINMLIVAGLAVLIHLVMIAFVSLVFRNKSNDKKINCLHFASVFGNCGYMGLPFLQSLFSGGTFQGEIMVYAGVIIAVFNILTWSIGIYMVTGDKKQISIKNALLNPTIIGLIIGVIFFFALKKPIVDIANGNENLDFFLTKLMGVFNALADAVTPLAMIVIGTRLARIKPSKLFTDKWAYVSALNKLVIMSLFTMVIVALLPISNVIKYALFFCLSMPSATNTVLFTVKFGGDRESGSVFVVLSTILSIVTIPLMLMVFQSLFGIVI